MDKIKVIIFGTGWAFNNYIKNYREEYQIVGITDWDFKKHGKEIKGIKVVDPYKIHDLDYDKILVLSYFVKEIKEQLLQNCNITDEKLILPPKYKMKSGKPFENEETFNFGMEMINFLTMSCQNKQVNLFLEYGTLLGFVRDGGIIRWDDDIDFAIDIDDTKKFKDLIINLKDKLPLRNNIKWCFESRQDEKGNDCYFSLYFENDLNFNSINNFEFGIRVRKTFGNLSVVMKDKYLACDAEHFEQHEKLNINENIYIVPKNYKKYLTFVYGNWGTPEVLDFSFREGNYETSHLNHYKAKKIINIKIF